MPSPRAEDNHPLTVVVVGASGDLARKKVFPALFALFCQDLLPSRFHVVGLARTAMTDERFRERIMEYLTCRHTPENDCAQRMDDFLARCTYVTGQYDSADSFLEVYANAKIHEGDSTANRALLHGHPALPVHAGRQRHRRCRTRRLRRRRFRRLVAGGHRKNRLARTANPPTPS